MLKKVDVGKLLNDLVRSHVDAITGLVRPEDLIEEALTEAKALCKGLDLVRDLLKVAFDEELGHRMLAIPNPAGQLDFFARQQAEQQFVRHGDGRVSRMGLATYDVVRERREKQIKNMRHTNKAFEREEEVRDLVMPVMEKDRKMTFMEACQQVNLF